MTETGKILAQTNPSATTLTDSYTCPAATSAVITSVVVANRSGTATAFRLALAVAGAADNAKQYLAYDVPILGNETKSFTIGITLATTDVLRVYATLATISFTVLGFELT